MGLNESRINEGSGNANIFDASISPSKDRWIKYLVISFFID